MSLAFNTYLDRWKQRLLQFTCDHELNDHLLRSSLGLAYKDFKLTAAQMDALNATPVELIAAPGAGKAIVVEGAFTKVVAGGTAFDIGSGVLSFLYTDGSGAKVASDVTEAVVEAAQNTTTYYRSAALAVVPVVNAKIVAKASADVTAGNGTVYGRIWYRVVKVAELV